MKISHLVVLVLVLLSLSACKETEPILVSGNIPESIAVEEVKNHLDGLTDIIYQALYLE